MTGLMDVGERGRPSKASGSSMKILYAVSDVFLQEAEATARAQAEAVKLDALN